MKLLKPFRVTPVIAAAALLLLNACGGGAETQENPPTTVAPSSTYAGPAPSFPDVQSFRVNLWENIRGGDRCGACHNAGGQSPEFARSDDVNLAYAEALPLVDLENPTSSRLVAKVAGGHTGQVERRHGDVRRHRRDCCVEVDDA